MAIVNPDTITQTDIPHEPGQWIKHRVCMQDDLEAIEIRLGPDAGAVARSRALIARLIVEWSYDVPVSDDAIRHLDIPTYVWLMQVLQVDRAEQEKKDFETPSGPTTAPDVAAIPAS